MDLSSRTFVKNLLKKWGVHPFKGFGQNFLVDKKVLRKIVEAADLKTEDVVLEIGPGIGTLTQELAKRVKKVIAVEKDKKMVEILKETLNDFKNVEIICEDIRKSDFPKTPGVDEKTPGVKAGKSNIQNYKIVANLPFYLVAPVIRKFLELSEARPQSMVLMVQKEVGQRICAKPPKMNLLAVAVQFYAEPKIISYVPKTSFWPQPKVDAAIIKITPTSKSVQTPDVCTFFKIVKAGFSQPRKQILNNLSKKLKLDKEKIKSWLLGNRIQPTQRAETLSMEDWISLAKT